MSRWLGRIRRQLGLWVGLLMVGSAVTVAILAPVISPYSPDLMNIGAMMTSPSSDHLLGTDNFGRDILTRLFYGARVSLLVGFSSVLLAGSIGTALGLLAGYVGGFVNTLIMRITDIVLSFPIILLSLALVAVLGPSAENVVLALGLSYWATYARIVRAATLRVRAETFIEAAQAAGVGSLRIMVRHILPSIAGPILVSATLGIGAAIVAEASLDFLGLGVQPPTATWGAMSADGLRYLSQNADLATFAGIAIMWTVLGFNLLGDALTDAMNPRTAKIATAEEAASAAQEQIGKEGQDSAALVSST
jgi:peptide/nickel transport system permease protein